MLEHSEIHERWSAAYRTPEAARFYDDAFDFVAGELRGVGVEMVLDLGCGTCAQSIRLAKRGFDVCAVDISEWALDEGRRAVRAEGLENQIEVRQENLLKLSFEDASFKAILCWGVLMHIPDLDIALDEISRVVTDGGVVVVNEVNASSLEARFWARLKRILKKGVPGRRTDLGIEYWSETPSGTLLSRHADIARLSEEFRDRGFRLQHRRAGQFTELYTRVSSRWVRRALHAFDRFWFKRVRHAPSAFTNLLIFKMGARPDAADRPRN